ncbi:uncharacterized protein ISCGN_000994 [Ixodes scapularis]
MLLVRASLGQTEVDLKDLCSDTEEYVGVTVEIKGRPVTFVSAYVRPQGHWDPKTIVDICTQIKDIAATAAALADLPPLQERPQPMDVDLHIPGLRSRRTATTVTLRTLALSHIEDQYHGWAQVFTDGSVRPTDGSSTAAAAFEAAGVGLSARLAHHATSTTTELAAILLALEAVQKGSTRGGKWAVLCDSQAAFSMLDNLERISYDDDLKCITGVVQASMRNKSYAVEVFGLLQAIVYGAGAFLLFQDWKATRPPPPPPQPPRTN